MNDTEAAGLGQHFKFVVPASELKRALFLANIVCPKRSTIPLLAHARLTVENGILSVDATDLDNHLRSTIAVDAWGNGSVAVRTQDLLKIVSRLSGPIEFDLRPEDIKIRLHAGPTSYILPCLAADEFPQAPEVETPHVLTLSADEYRTVVDGVRYAISKEEVRYYLNGVYLEAPEGKLRACATDGHRLARSSIDFHAGELPGIIIPTVAVRLLSEITKADPIALSFSADKLHGLFQCGHVMLRSKMIDGTYPDTERVIPKNHDRKATFDAAALVALIRRLSPVNERSFYGFQFSWTAGEVVVRSAKSLWGEATEAMPVSYEGPPFDIGFNYRYLVDALKGCAGEAVIHMAGHKSPVSIVDPARPGMMQILMPMRIT
jgi:DNA polymerase-3 subunit beta